MNILSHHATSRVIPNNLMLRYSWAPSASTNYFYWRSWGSLSTSIKVSSDSLALTSVISLASVIFLGSVIVLSNALSLASAVFL